MPDAFPPGQWPPQPGPFFPPPQYPANAPNWAATPALAGYGVRLGGWFIDWLIVSVGATAVMIMTGSIHHSRTAAGTSGITYQSGYSIGTGGVAIHAVIAIVYGAILCGSKRGQTVGMMAVGIKAVDQNSGKPIGVPRAAGRAAFEYLMAILLFVPWIIDMLFPLWDPRKQTLHDKVTATVVVRT